MKKIEVDKTTERDTLEDYPNRHLQIVDLIHEGFLGNFSTSLCVIKKITNSTQISYELEQNNNEWGRISKDYIAFVKPYTHLNRGWFHVKNGIIKDDLPGMNRIIDSLKASYPNNYFIRETNGYIEILNNGKTVKELNYGNFVTRLKNGDFDKIDYRLYKLNGDSLSVISNNGNDLLSQKEGIFFVPSPGYNVIQKYNKSEILKIVDSISHLSLYPDKFFVEPVN